MRIEIRIECPAWATDQPDPRGLVEVALAEAGEVIDDAGLRGREVCVVLGDDAFSRRLNDTWRGRDGATNVLAFPTMAPGAWREIPAEVEESLGDIVLARDVVVEEARVQGKPLAWHFTHLVLHGYLHLLGYDHGDDGSAREMEDMERRILARLGIPDPYEIEADRASATP